MSICSRNLLLLFFLTSFFQVSAQEKVYPQKGEGLMRFLIRNKIYNPKNKQEFITLNKKKLGKGNSLIFGLPYLIPKTKNTLHYSILGEKDANISVISNTLKGASFYLVSGHGGPDPGAICKRGKIWLHEDEYAYDITLRLAKFLWSHQAKVHLIIKDPTDGIRKEKLLSNSKNETCRGEKMPLNQKKRLNQRCSAINVLYKKNNELYKRAIFIHVDSRSKKKKQDVFFYHFTKSKQGYLLAENIRTTFEKKYNLHQPNRGFTGTVSARELYVLKHTIPASVFIELGNLQNKHNQQRFILAENRNTLAKWIGEGLIRDFKEHKISISKKK